jgi:hypothetical protein
MGRLLPLLSLLLLPFFTFVSPTSFDFAVDLTTTHTTDGLRYAGANFLSPALLSLSVPANRVGGDDQTVYNPLTDSSNADNDFFWANGAPYRPFQEVPARGQSFVDLMVANTVKANSTLFMLIPLAGWVANGVADCGSFPLAEYGHQQKEWTKYGNGVYPNGTLLSGDWRCYIPFTLPQVMAWLTRLRGVIGGDTFDRHVVIQLDNESVGDDLPHPQPPHLRLALTPRSLLPPLPQVRPVGIRAQVSHTHRGSSPLVPNLTQAHSSSFSHALPLLFLFPRFRCFV